MYEGDSGEDAAIESNLRATIRLNADFAPAHDALAMFYATRERKLNEAYGLSTRAIELDPDSLIYRVDCADVMMEQEQFTEALEMLGAARRLAKTPYEVDAVESRVARVERRRMAQAAPAGRVKDVSLELPTGRGNALPDGVDKTLGVDGIGQ